MKVKPWAKICSKACWEATEKRCRCRCHGLFHGGRKLKCLAEFEAHEVEEEKIVGV